MKPITINRQSVPQRCEICHQTDHFVPEQNYCARCQGIVPTNVAAASRNVYRPPVTWRQRLVAGSCFGLASFIPVIYFWGTFYLLFSLPQTLYKSLPLGVMLGFILTFTLVPSAIATLVGGSLGVRILTPPPNATRNYAKRIGGQVALWSYLGYTLLLSICLTIYGSIESSTYDSASIVWKAIAGIIGLEILFFLVGGVYILWLIILVNRGAAALLDKFCRAKGLTLIPESKEPVTRIKLTSSPSTYE